MDVYAVTRDGTAGDGTLEPTAGTQPSETAASRGETLETSTENAPSSNAGETSEPGTSNDSASSPEPVCPTATAVPGDTSITVAVGSLERTYVLHVPPNYDASRPAPLIVDFHGAGSSGWDELQMSGYPAVTDPEGVLMAFPDGVAGPIGTAWNVGPCCVPGVDDLAFVDALLADVRQRACVDTRRTYAVGLLTGGGMAHYLACERSADFAAVSPSAFDLAEETVPGCEPTSPVGVVAFRGTADPRVPYEGGSSMLVPNMTVTFLGAQASFRRWAEINGCTGEPSSPDVRGCSAFTECPGGVEVVLCTEQDGVAEPGDASVAWPILARHQR